MFSYLLALRCMCDTLALNSADSEILYLLLRWLLQLGQWEAALSLVDSRDSPKQLFSIVRLIARLNLEDSSHLVSLSLASPDKPV